MLKVGVDVRTVEVAPLVKERAEILLTLKRNGSKVAQIKLEPHGLDTPDAALAYHIERWIKEGVYSIMPRSGGRRAKPKASRRIAWEGPR
jgi:hypothetical protein